MPSQTFTNNADLNQIAEFNFFETRTSTYTFEHIHGFGITNSLFSIIDEGGGLSDEEQALPKLENLEVLEKKKRFDLLLDDYLMIAWRWIDKKF